MKGINHPWWLTLDEAGVDSVVMFPLQYNGEVMGFIWATNLDTQNTLQIKETLELTTYFLSSQIANYNMVKRLEHFSFTDILTVVQNRNAMRRADENMYRDKKECYQRHPDQDRRRSPPPRMRRTDSEWVLPGVIPIAGSTHD